MRIKEGFVLRTVMGQHIIVAEGKMHSKFNKMISMNPSAALLWESVTGKDFTINDLANTLEEHYDIGTEEAHKDAAEVAQKWVENGLVDA